jgi:DNA repair protein RecO (recombination protein O)
MVEEHMATRSSQIQAVVLKRSNVGEYDRMVTLVTPDQGKVVAVAKGVRKLTSSKRAALEPGNHVSLLLIKTSSMPLIAQSKLLCDFPSCKKDLKSMKKLAEVLEIIDKVFAEGLEEPELFQEILVILTELNSPDARFARVKTHLTDMLIQLGYQDMAETQYTSILDYVAAVAERPMRSYQYLTVRKDG